MKYLIINLILISVLAASCNNKKATTEKVPLSSDSSNATSKERTVSSPAAAIISAYLQLKNALANDNSNGAATAGLLLRAAFKKFNKTELSGQQLKEFTDIEPEAVENAQHIGSNGGNISHQRMHFESLSEDIYDLAKTIGAGQILYKETCPKSNAGKETFWLSESKEIKNPYMGKSTSACAVVQEEIK